VSSILDRLPGKSSNSRESSPSWSTTRLRWFTLLKPLVIWPVGGGNVLFASILWGTRFFTRKLRPSTHHSKCGALAAFRSFNNVIKFVKHDRYSWSASSRYVDTSFTLLPSRVSAKPISKRKQDQYEEDSKMTLALLVSTYRLCNKQVSRCPPSLVHKARVELGPVASLSVSTLPFKLTWRAESAFTWRAVM